MHICGNYKQYYPLSVVYTPLCIILSKRVYYISIVRAGSYFQMQNTVLPSFDCKKSNENDLRPLVQKVCDIISGGAVVYFHLIDATGFPHVLENKFFSKEVHFKAHKYKLHLSNKTSIVEEKDIPCLLKFE